MDIRFTRFDCLSLAQDEWPQDLQNYFRDLRSLLVSLTSGAIPYVDWPMFSLSGEETTQPDAPLILEYQDATYVLQFSSSIRQSSEVVSPAVSGLATHFRTISESSLDLESSQKSTSCQVQPSILFISSIHPIFLGTMRRCYIRYCLAILLPQL
jgi:hypothetical protein